MQHITQTPALLRALTSALSHRWPTLRIGTLIIGLTLFLSAGCQDRSEVVRLARENQAFRGQLDEASRTITSQQATIDQQHQQIQNLRGWEPKRPLDLFSPVKIEIVSRSRGTDLDGQPGDDGVTVYVRPVDADGHPVKTPGTIHVQLLDTTEMGRPRVVGACSFDDAKSLRDMWYEYFGTQHYTAVCRFQPNALLPEVPALEVVVEFVDWLTGHTLRAVRQIPFTRPPATTPSSK